MKLTGGPHEDCGSQVPALPSALSGMDMHELMANVKSMRARPNGTAGNSYGWSARSRPGTLLREHQTAKESRHGIAEE